MGNLNDGVGLNAKLRTFETKLVKTLIVA